MAAARAKDDDPLAPIKDAVRAGKLTEIREWIRVGKPLLYQPGDKRYSVLEVAARTGFYAVVEELLKVWTNKDALNRALDRALQARHTQVATLLVEHGADVNRHWLSTIAEYYDPDLMKAFLDRSGDVTKENALAHAIAVGARPLARVFKEYCANIPGGNIQLAMALRHFASKQNLRWVSLCVWMGADPRLLVPDLEPPYDDESSTALEDAFYDPTMALIKPLHVDPKRDDVNHLLSKIQYFNRAVVEHLLALGAKLNDKPNGGCSLLEKCFENLAYDVRASLGIGLNRASEDDVHVLVKHGARFIPDDNRGYRGIREAIARLDSHRRPEFLKLLATATTPEILMKIVSTPSMQEKLGITPKRLMEKLGLQPSAEPLHAKAKPATRKPPQVAGRPKEKAMDSPPVKADTPSVAKPAQAPEPARAASSRARDESLERAAELRKEAIARGPITLTRQELYNAVWSQAMWTLAPSFGLSDVGLAKICRKHNIPHPPLGYWAKKEQGKATQQPLLPNPEDNPSITIQPYRSLDPLQNEAVREEASASLARLAEVIPTIHVPQRLTSPHPLILETQETVQEAREQQGGWTNRPSRKRRLNVYVSESQWQRALCILDALFKALEAQGHKVRIDENEHTRNNTVVEIFEEDINIGLSDGKDGLRLYIDEYIDAPRKTWQDGKRQRVEEMLPEFIEALIAVAAQMKERSLIWQREREERERKQKEIEAEIAAYKAEEQRMNALFHESECWHRARKLREYVEALRSLVLQKDGEIAAGSEVDKWIGWALKQADRLDPLVESPPSILDKKPPTLR